MEAPDTPNTDWLTGFLCQLKAPSLNTSVHIPPCDNTHINSAKARLLDCQQWNTTQAAEEYEYFLCAGHHNSFSQCKYCAGNSTSMFNMTLRLLLLGDEDDVIWARIPNVIKSVSCSVGGFMDMFMDCSSPKSANVTSEDFISTVTSGNVSFSQKELFMLEESEGNKSAAIREAIGEYVKCSLQSVLLNVESTTGGVSTPSGFGEYSDSETHHHDWSFLFVLAFIVAGGVGNILVCLAVCMDRRLQNVTNYFLLSLAIADLLVSLFVMPLGAIPGFLGKFLSDYLLKQCTVRQNQDLCSMRKKVIASNISVIPAPKKNNEHDC
jgi:hypothetical protein